MNIHQFMEQVNGTILERGYDYYLEERVIVIDKQGDEKFTFFVDGTDDYVVAVHLDENGEIVYSNCDCPYDHGPICKHEVAAYFELKEILDEDDDDSGLNKETSQATTVRAVLSNLPKEELIDIIIDITKKDATLRNRLILQYNEEDSEETVSYCQNLIDSIVKKYTDRHGSIKYREAQHFAYELEEILDKVRDTRDASTALDIAFLLLNEAIEAYQYADDSSGSIGSLVTQTIEAIQQIATESANKDAALREALFYKLLKQAKHQNMKDWEDYQLDIYQICVGFADIESLRKSLKSEIQDLATQYAMDEYSSYYVESLYQILLELVEEYGTEAELEEFMKTNRHFPSFRKQLINQQIAQENYKQALALVVEGEKQDKQLSGLLSDWKKIRYQIYKECSLIEEQKVLAKELFFDGNFHYYNDLKELETGDFDSFYQKLKQELRNGEGYYVKEMYLQLIKKEKDVDALMAYVREHPRSIETYAETLIDHYKEEVVEIYKRHLESIASSSTSRKQYQNVCSVLELYGEIVGDEEQEELISKFKLLYKNRPAFIDELNRLRR